MEETGDLLKDGIANKLYSTLAELGSKIKEELSEVAQGVPAVSAKIHGWMKAQANSSVKKS